MSNNLLIVESYNDKFFIERLQRELRDADFLVDKPIINDFECLGGLTQKSLQDKLQEVSFDIGKRGLSKIGILVDANSVGIQDRVELINKAIKSIDPNMNMLATNTWYNSASLDVSFSCHILNVNGFGELETLLKTIKNKSSPYADCLNAWRSCLDNADAKAIGDKDFNKFWVNVYQRYDGCSKDDQKQAGRKCNLQASLEKDLWDFSHSVLHDLKAYLQAFNN
ncbi:DUF3226 domain-containing protein [Methylocucumis oryzae]|uniref:DUF4276 domain-containing protein n=1 Tax=Methylocucumis oryzae TaxID=1632867 RepID=A0A0F3IJ30_9GAMM|nr:DUF3226 domain-containing protein [Methylocucumis oryzae]KJV06538.1 hypothetical protein VZ94_10570 [Methylocucumis oryzae]